MKNPREEELFLRTGWPKGPQADLSRISDDSTRLLVVDLDGGLSGGVLRKWAALSAAIAGSSELDQLARHGGTCLALAAYVAASRNAEIDEPTFAISVGDAVRRGLPTAARATVTGRAPLRDGLVEAPFGGALAQALVRTTDVLLVLGAAPEGRWVLSIDKQGQVSKAAATVALGAETAERAGQWAPEGVHALLVGPAAEVGIPFANLGSWDGIDGERAPSLVGRGGLGATVARAGVVAITVADQLADDSERAEDLFQALESSPRLLARAKGGTLELGAVRAHPSVRDQEGHKGSIDTGPTPRVKHGCRGCPTPCGWQFERPARAADREREGGDRSRIGGRFAALQGFLGAGSTAEALAALETCNAIGVDARTASATMSVARPADWGAALGALLDPSTDAHRRAVALTSSGDQEPANPLMPSDLAGRVGVALAARGPEPLRSLSVLGLHAAETADPFVREKWGRDLHLSGLTENVEYNAGVLAHWQECFSAAIDHSGFCAFSGSALIADGVLTFDELAEEVTGATDGTEWLGVGAVACSFHRELQSQSTGGESGLPEPAVRGYRMARAAGWVRVESSPEQQSCTQPRAGAVLAGDSPQADRYRGLIGVLASGLLASKLKVFPGAKFHGDVASGGQRVRLEIPVGEAGLTIRELIHHLAETLPGARTWLVGRDGLPLPAVLIAGQATPTATVVHSGDELEFLLVIPGG